MKKRTENDTPEQETEEVSEEQNQETEVGSEETEETVQERDEAAAEEAAEVEEESEQTEETEDTREGTQQQESTNSGVDENAGLRSELLQAKGKLAAYAAGVAPDVIDDAVTLAMAEAAKSGEATEAAVTKAMEAVLKRHPEWKADAGDKKKTGGFKLGADRDSGSAFRKQNNTTQNVKRWNRFK